MSNTNEPASAASVLFGILRIMNTGSVYQGLKRKSFMISVGEILETATELKADPRVIGGLVTSAVTYPHDVSVQNAVFRTLKDGSSDAHRYGLVEMLHRHPHAQGPGNTDAAVKHNRALFMNRLNDVLTTNPAWKTLPEVKKLGLS
jgi:hypothetical protein